MKTLPDIKNKFNEWYQEVIYVAELADQSPVRGSIVIRPYGYAMWEHIRDILDAKIKKTGTQNASFPLLIPESFLKREAEHVEGFAPELAVVTHAGGKELEEPLVIRPTSETMIHYMFARWISSWRDLPLKINQWANVMRWEMRPRAFLRTTEFFWQEGHTAHETHEQAWEMTQLMLSEYVDLAHSYLAIPVIAGTKSEQEKFPGAEKTLTFEGVMQDGKALQMGTSHLLSQSFAVSFNIQFQNREGVLAHPYLTSWGATTRLIGAVVMVHGDQKGLVLPPKIAPIQVVIIPIFKANESREAILNAVHEIAKSLSEQGIRVFVDADDHKTPGAKFWHWEIKGVPLRLELGPRDLSQNKAMVTDRLGLAKEAVSINTLPDYIKNRLTIIQATMFERAQERMKSHWHKGEKLQDFGPQLMEHNGVYQTGWCQRVECEKLLKQYQATTRCLLNEKTHAVCFNCDLPSVTDVIVAKSY